VAEYRLLGQPLSLRLEEAAGRRLELWACFLGVLAGYFQGLTHLVVDVVAT
jgi:hypothetical protein